MDIQTTNPATGELIKHYLFNTAEQSSAAIEAGHLAFNAWRRTSFATRQALMRKLATLLRSQKVEFAKLIATEMGKPVTLGQLEIEKCATVCEHFAEHAETYLKGRLIQTSLSKTKVCYEPLGVIFAIMPWNFPFWQVFRFAAPTLMAGNAALLKHAPITTGCGEAIVHLFLEAGFPIHLFQQLILDNDSAAAVIAHPRVSAVTLTGSDRAGREVASFAGAHLKKCVLELGGNDAYLVLEDADITCAAKAIVTSRLSNTGQVCIAAKRIIAVEAVVDSLLKAIMALIPNYVSGSPLLDNTLLGPMARADLRKTLHDQVTRSVHAGATLVLGGGIPSGAGFYYPPTILMDVRPGMPAFDEELFGPVIAITQATDEAHAISLANDSQYGLSGAVFTRDVVKGERIAEKEMEVGTCYVNTFVASDPRVPFGGIKASGYGRELSREGILEFVNVKTIGVA